MANALYPKWKEQLLQFTANNNLSAGTVKVALVDTGVYTYNSADQFYDASTGSDVQSATVGTPQTLGSKTFTNGTFDAADVTFTAVTGSSVEALVIYIDTGTPTTSPLVAYIDTSVTGLPVTPNGGNITITWNASGIFTL
jgi:hypothetical protein